MTPRSLCRRHRRSPNSRQRFLPHPETLGGSLRRLASTCPPVPQRTRHSRALTSLLRPTRAWPCPCVFASTPASRVTLARPPDTLGLSLERAIPRPSAQFHARISRAGPRASWAAGLGVLARSSGFVASYFSRFSYPPGRRRCLLAAQPFAANGPPCRDRQRGLPGPSPEMRPARNHSPAVDRHQRVRP